MALIYPPSSLPHAHHGSGACPGGCDSCGSRLPVSASPRPEPSICCLLSRAGAPGSPPGQPRGETPGTTPGDNAGTAWPHPHTGQDRVSLGTLQQGKWFGGLPPPLSPPSAESPAACFNPFLPWCQQWFQSLFTSLLLTGSPGQPSPTLSLRPRQRSQATWRGWEPAGQAPHLRTHRGRQGGGRL